MRVAWFSGGVSSFISIYLAKDIDKIFYIHIEEQHEDTLRFLKDCEVFLGRKIEILQSPYKSVENVMRINQMISRRMYAPCTDWLKKRVRIKWESENKDKDITYVWGYDLEEKDRIERMIEFYPDYQHEFPLADANMTKQDAHGLLERLGLKRPVMYDLGYKNNNCIGCVKGGMAYWNKIRVDFPDVFDKMAKFEREIDNSCLKQLIDKKYIPLFLDELAPDRGIFEDEISSECGMMCFLNM